MEMYYVYGSYGGIAQEFLIGMFDNLDDAMVALRNSVTLYADVWIRKRTVKVGLTK